MDSMTCCQTVCSPSSSRCTNTANLNFSRTGQLVSASLQTTLFEYSRVMQKNANESGFHIFYQMVYGASEELKRELFLSESEHDDSEMLFKDFQPDKLFVEKHRTRFNVVLKALKALSLTEDEIKSVLHMVAACLHLDAAGSIKLTGNRYQFAKANSAQKAASLLGTTVEKLLNLIFQSAKMARSKTYLDPSIAARTNSMAAANATTPRHHGLETFIMELYHEAFQKLMQLINRSLNSVHRFQNSILLVNSPGYQGSNCSRVKLSDLAYNYLQDRWNSCLYYNAITRPKQRFRQEDIEVDVVIPDNDEELSCVEIIDSPGHIQSNKSKGIFWLIEEEASSPGGTSQTLIERILYNFNKNQKVVKRSPNKNCFLLSHMNGTYWVEYDTSDWLHYNFVVSSKHKVLEVLHESKKSFIYDLFAKDDFSMVTQGVGSPTLRRVSSIRKHWNVPGSKNNSYCGWAKTAVDQLLERIYKTNSHFVAGLSTLSSPSNDFDLLTVRQQLRGLHLLSIARMHKQGYPEHLVMSEFNQRFDVLSKPVGGQSSSIFDMTDNKERAEKILQHVDLDSAQYRLGISVVFFRSGILARLEGLRNEKISATLINLQSVCRGYLARKRFDKRKVQVVAVRCIQRNVRKLMAVQQWPWWKLVTRILPLVEVNRTEEELNEKSEEIDQLREKLRKITADKESAEKLNEKYEDKIQEIMQLVEEERASASNVVEMLQHETNEKQTLQKSFQDVQVTKESLEKKVETLEVELAEKRLMFTTDTHVMNDSEDAENDVDYKVKYERSVKEMDFKLKQQSRELEDALEDAKETKKTMERKIIQLNEEIEEHVRVEGQSKKKVLRLHSELGDTKIALEEISAKNHDLEKKQRRFDSDLLSLQADVTELRNTKDRLQREKDRLLMENNTYVKEVEMKDDELEVVKGKIKLLEDELDENDTRDIDEKQTINSMKKKIRELESKSADQEEELDEQAGKIFILEQTRERFELAAEQAKQQQMRQANNKEEEFEEIRSSYQKKIKSLESQLEEADEERAKLQKQKREVEQQFNEMKDKNDAQMSTELERQLRKDLKRYKTLLADAQTLIDHLKTDVVNKSHMKQLKTQLEESEYSCAAAVKARKAMELEIEDLQAQLDETSKAKQDSENRVSQLQHEVHDLRSKSEEDIEDATEIMNKYKNVVKQLSDEKDFMVELQGQVEELKREKSSAEDKVIQLQSQIDFLESSTTDNATASRLENKGKDLELKLEFQKTANRRLEVQLARVKENMEKIGVERDANVTNAQRDRDSLKKIQKQLRESKEEQAELLKKEQDALAKKHSLELELEDHKNQNESLQSELKLAFKRINDLQTAFEDLDDLDLMSTDYEDTDDDAPSVYDGDTWRSRSRMSSVASGRLSSRKRLDSVSSERPSSSASFISEVSTASKAAPTIGNQRPDLSDLLSRYSINKRQQLAPEGKSIDKKSVVDEVEKEMTIDYLDRRLAAKDPTLTLFASRPSSRAASRAGSRAGSRMGSPADDLTDPANAFKPTNRSKKADRELESHERKLSDLRKLKSSAEDFIQAAKERAIARNNMLNGVDPEKAESEMEKRAMTPFDKTRQEFADRRARERIEKKYTDKYQSFSDNEFDYNSDEDDLYGDTSRRPSTNMGFYEKNSSPPDHSRDHRGSYSRPSSRQESHRPSSRQDHYRRPSSRQEYNDRPTSRQDHYNRPSSRQDYRDRPSSRHDYSDYSDNEDNDRDYNGGRSRRGGSRVSSKNHDTSNRRGSRQTYQDDAPSTDRRGPSRAMRHEDLRGASPRSASRSLRYEDLKTESSSRRSSPRSEDSGNNGGKSKSRLEKDRRSSSRAAAFDEEDFRNSLYSKGPAKSDRPRAKKYTPSRRSHYPSDESDNDDDDDVSLSRFDVNDDVNSLHSGDSSYSDIKKLKSGRGNSFEKDLPSGKRSSAKSKMDDAEISSLHSRSRRPTSSAAKSSAAVNSDSGEASDDMNLDSLITRYLFKK